MSEYSDQELIESLASNDRLKNNQVLKYIYGKYFKMIEQLILKNSGTPEQAADIFQDGLIVLYNKAKDPEFELKSALSTYLYAICRNLWLKKLRTKDREIALEDSMLYIADEQASNVAELIRTERGDIIADLIDKMGEDCKNILRYFYFEKLRMKEIMQKMNISSEAVAKNKKSNCMKTLRKKVLSSPFYQNLLK